MTEKVVILHVLFPANNFTMTRTIFTPTESDMIDYHCILPVSCKAQLQKKQYYDLYNNVKFTYVKHIGEVNNEIKLLKPDAIFITNSPNNKFTRDNKIPVYYLHHGIFNHSRSSEYRKKLGQWHQFSVQMFLCSDQFQYDFLTGIGCNCTKIPGIPQFDLIYKLKPRYKAMKETFLSTKKLSPEIPIILVIGSHDTGSTSLYRSLHESIRKVLPNSHIIYKAKFQGNINVRDKKNITQLNMNSLIHEFLFADLIVVHTYGTSFIEGLIANPKTLLLDPQYKNTYSAPLVYKNVSGIHAKLREIYSDSFYESDEFLTRTNNYLEKVIGEQVREVLPQVISIVNNTAKTLQETLPLAEPAKLIQPPNRKTPIKPIRPRAPIVTPPKPIQPQPPSRPSKTIQPTPKPVQPPSRPSKPIQPPSKSVPPVKVPIIKPAATPTKAPKRTIVSPIKRPRSTAIKTRRNPLIRRIQRQKLR